MAKLSAEVICEISDKAWTDKANWDKLLQECFEHALPDRNPYYDNGTGKPQPSSQPKGQDKTSKRVYDSTLMADSQKLANRLQSELFPIGDEWARLVPGAFVETAEQEEARGELKKLQTILFAAISLSNFDLAIAEWLLELVVAGTAVMLVQRGNDQHPIVYQAIPQSHVALREGAFGFIDMISRKHKLRRSLIPQMWKDAKKVPKDHESEDETHDPELELIEVTYLDHVDGIWRYNVILIGGLKNKGNDKHILVEREYDVNPWAIARWSKAAGEAQGRSLVMNALPDARVISAVKKYLLQQAALAIGGVFLVRNDGVINANNVRIFPGATIPVRSTGGGNTGASVAPLQVGGDINLANLILDDLTNSIHKIMLNDGMPELKDGVRTATEFLERLKDLQQSLGAPFSRVLKEGIVPMLEATFSVLGEMGVVSNEEGGTIKLNGGEVAVNWTSPLVQQQALREVEAAVNASQVTRQIAGVQAGEQAVALSFKVEELGHWVNGKLGVDPAIIRSKEEAKKLEAAAGQMAGQQVANENGAVPGVGGAGGVPSQQQAA